MGSKRGRHQSTDKDGQRAMDRIRAVPGVTAVIIGHSIGGKSLGSGAGSGSLRIQRSVPGGCKGLVQTARGVQEIFIQIDSEQSKTTLFRLRQLSD